MNSTSLVRLGSHIRCLVASLVMLLTAPCWACNIVYGKDWALLSQNPEGWSSACHTQAMPGTILTLWPTDQGPRTTDALIYVTVSAKGSHELSEFVADAQARFVASAKTTTLRKLDAPPTPQNLQLELVAISGAPPGSREEMVAYFSGPTAFYIAVLTAESASVLTKHKAAFLQFLNGLNPIERK